MGGRLDGRRIVITGCASGIGAATARLFHKEGAKLAVIDREEAALKRVAEPLGAYPMVFDLTDLAQIEPRINEAARHLGGLDGVVNCAGLGIAVSMEDMTLDLLMNSIHVNLTAPYLLCKAALPHLRRAVGSTIVNIASGQAVLPNGKNITAYAASKGGLHLFTKALAVEVAPEVRANVLCPGATNTPMVAPLIAGYNDPSQSPFVQQYPMKRLAEPEEIAQGILFLTSAESSYVTGSALMVDGGRCLH